MDERAKEMWRRIVDLTIAVRLLEGREGAALDVATQRLSKAERAIDE